MSYDEITILNIDDYIRACSANGIRKILHPKKQWDILCMFVHNNGFSPQEYMGVTHVLWEVKK